MQYIDTVYAGFFPPMIIGVPSTNVRSVLPTLRLLALRLFGRFVSLNARYHDHHCSTLVCREVLQQGVLRLLDKISTNYVAAKKRLQSGHLSYLNRSGATRNAISCRPCGSETLQEDMHGVRSPKLEQLTG